MGSEEEIAGRGVTPNPAHEDRRHYSAGAWESRQHAEWRQVKTQIRGLKVPLRFAVDLRPTPDALCDPRFGSRVLQLLMECGVSAITGGVRECHGCCRRWTRERAVVAVGVVEFLNFQGGGLVGLCSDCWDRPDRIQIALDGFKRDFGLASIEAASIHDGGRA